MQTQRLVSILCLVLLTVFMTSCELIGDIFKAGAYTGIIGVVLVIGLVIWLISRLFGGGRSNNV